MFDPLHLRNKNPQTVMSMASFKPRIILYILFYFILTGIVEVITIHIGLYAFEDGTSIDFNNDRTSENSLVFGFISFKQVSVVSEGIIQKYIKIIV